MANLTLLDWIEYTAVLFGLVCVLFTIRRNIWCWPTGLVQVTLFVYIFWEVKLYSDLALHLIYIPMQIYGWYHWLHGGNQSDTLPVSRLSSTILASWSLVLICGTLLLGYVMSSQTDAALPYPDAFTTVASLIAQWLLARKVLDSWGFWIAVDIAAIGIYWSKGLLATAGLYAVFLVLATIGLLAWRKAMQRQVAFA